MDEEKRQLISEAVLGKKVENFYKTDIGQYVLGAAKQDVEAAQEKLANVSPFMFWKVHQHQADIRIAKQALIWLNDVILMGRQAQTILEEGGGI